MSAVLPSAGDLPVLATVECPNCSVIVPDARFCGACGASLDHGATGSPRRLHAYTAFPDEPVLRLSAVTSLFPQLPSRAKAPFRLALGVVAALLLLFALAGMSAPLIALCALGIPLLFLLYLWEVDPYEGSFVVPTVICLAVGAGLGVAWALVGGKIVGQALQPLVGVSLVSSHSLAAAVVVPAAAQLLMCVPMLIVWALQRGTRESLDGFAAGASGALGFTAAATITLMAPWFGDGQLVHQPFADVLSQTVLRGVSFPLVSAMTTGFVGATLWVTARSRGALARGLTSPMAALVVALLIQIGLGFTDIAHLSSSVLVLVHLVAVGLSLVLVRIGIHHVLLHEALEVGIGPPMWCSHCGTLVPAMAFCPHCGVAERARARQHRSRLASGPPDPELAMDPGGAS